MKSNIIYILRLYNYKYYVGKTNCIDKTIIKYFHEKKYNLEWIKKNKPIDIEQVYNSQDINKYVYKYMSKYSIDNVRGGIYNNVLLNKIEIKNIKQNLTVQSYKNNVTFEYYQFYDKNSNFYKNIFRKNKYY